MPLVGKGEITMSRIQYNAGNWVRGFVWAKMLCYQRRSPTPLFCRQIKGSASYVSAQRHYGKYPELFGSSQCSSSWPEVCGTRLRGEKAWPLKKESRSIRLMGLSHMQNMAPARLSGLRDLVSPPMARDLHPSGAHTVVSKGDRFSEMMDEFPSSRNGRLSSATQDAFAMEQSTTNK